MLTSTEGFFLGKIDNRVVSMSTTFSPLKPIEDGTKNGTKQSTEGPHVGAAAAAGGVGALFLVYLVTTATATEENR
jgi:hypothetical protein